MTDIVERLRFMGEVNAVGKRSTAAQAADEIERLREALCLIGRGDIPTQYPNTANGYRRYAAHVLAKELGHE